MFNLLVPDVQNVQKPQETKRWESTGRDGRGSEAGIADWADCSIAWWRWDSRSSAASAREPAGGGQPFWSLKEVPEEDIPGDGGDKASVASVASWVHVTGREGPLGVADREGFLCRACGCDYKQLFGGTDGGGEVGESKGE